MLQQHQPDGRHRGRERHFLVVEQLVDGLAIHLGAGQHQFRSDGRRRECDTPRIGMEHRHNRQHCVLGANADGVGLHPDQGVQHVGAMRIEHALGIARRARRVAEPARRIFREVAPHDVGRMRRDVFLVGADVHRALRLVRRIRQHDPVLDARNLVLDRLDDRLERDVVEDVSVLGVVDDPGDLFGEQARVQRVQHGADAHRAIPGLDMAGGVPGQGRNPVALLDSISQQRVRALARAEIEIRIGRPDDRPLDGPGHDLARSVVQVSMLDHLVDGQLPVLHQAGHRAARDGDRLGRYGRCGGRFRNGRRLVLLALVLAKSKHVATSRMRLFRALASDPRRRHLPRQFFQMPQPLQRSL